MSTLFVLLTLQGPKLDSPVYANTVVTGCRCCPQAMLLNWCPKESKALREEIARGDLDSWKLLTSGERIVSEAEGTRL